MNTVKMLDNNKEIQQVEQDRVLRFLDQGWKIVEEWLNDNEKFFSSKLVHEVDIDKIRRFQEAAKCFGSVKSFVSSVIKQSMFLAERRDNQTPKGII